MNCNNYLFTYNGQRFELILFNGNLIMIAKLSGMSKSIFAKIILTLTALSFMSLFGVSGYIHTANSNKAVIKVDNIEISQSEFSYALQKEWVKLRALLGDDMSEDVADERKSLLAASFAEYKLNNALLDNTMLKHNIDFSQNLILNILMLTPRFQQNGQFAPQAFKQYLQQSGKSEREYIAEIKRNIARKILLETQVAGFNVPQTALKQMEKVLGQRRVFKYSEIKYSDIKPDRTPSQEELDQYYTDFSEEFIVPQKRNAKILFLSLDALADRIQVSPEEINEYYNEHIDDFEQPEKRDILQMIFNSEDEAKAVNQKLKAGADFKKVAAEAGQNDIDLGYVAADDLMSDLSQKAFALEKGEISEPFELNSEWQILKVADIKPASKIARDIANKQITQIIKQERAYDGSYEIINSIEDKLGAGTEIEALADDYNTSLIDVKNIGEDGSSDSRNADIASLLASRDIIDTVFSYNEGETSQAIELDNGIAVVKVEKILEEHVQPQEEVAEKLKNLWVENERASILQEKIDNIEHDLETGDDFAEISVRYGLRIKRTMPINRNENFAEISAQEITELFTLPTQQAKVIKRGDDYVFAYVDKIYDDSASLSEQDKKLIENSLYQEDLDELSNALLKDFAKNYKIEVNYNRMGITD